MPARVGKLRKVVIRRRLTFEAAFAYAAQELAGCTVALVNADIYFADHAVEPVLHRPALLHRTVRTKLQPPALLLAQRAPLLTCGCGCCGVWGVDRCGVCGRDILPGVCVAAVATHSHDRRAVTAPAC